MINSLTAHSNIGYNGLSHYHYIARIGHVGKKIKGLKREAAPPAGESRVSAPHMSRL